MIKEYIEAGKIVNTHGIAGAVKIEVWLDSPAYMKKFRRLFVGKNKQERKVISSSVQKNFLLTTLEGIADINTAMTLKEEPVFILREDAKLPAGGYFLCELIGAEVSDESGNRIGTLEEIMETPAQPVYVVRGEREYLIPAVPEFILFSDPENGLVKVHLLEGM